MDVCDSRGSRLGSVARVYRYDATDEPAATSLQPDAYDEVIEVKTGMLGLGKRLFVPFSNIQEVITDSVFLSIGGFDSDLEPFKHKPEYLDKLH
jgi:hypothetical protein